MRHYEEVRLKYSKVEATVFSGTTMCLQIIQWWVNKMKMKMAMNLIKSLFEEAIDEFQFGIKLIGLFKLRTSPSIWPEYIMAMKVR